MIIDEIFKKMGLERMDDIDDIDYIHMDAETALAVTEEYTTLFDIEHVVQLPEIGDYLGAPIKLSKEKIKGGFKFERKT